MSFLVLLLVLWVEKFSALRRRVQRDGVLFDTLQRLEARPSWAAHPEWLLTVVLVVPAVLLALLLAVLQPVAYGLFALPVHLLVVIYSLGRGDLQQALGPFRDAWRREDAQAAMRVAERDLGLTGDSSAHVLEQVQARLLWQAYEGFFAVIFWYALLGPVAALSYRLLALIASHSAHPGVAERAAQVRHAFDWLPVRLLAASFALVGNFVAVSKVMLHELLSWDISAAALIARVGRVAGEVPEPVVGPLGLASLDDLWQMLVRAAVLWYSGFAIWTVLGI